MNTSDRQDDSRAIIWGFVHSVENSEAEEQNATSLNSFIYSFFSLKNIFFKRVTALQCCVSLCLQQCESAIMIAQLVKNPQETLV